MFQNQCENNYDYDDYACEIPIEVHDDNAMQMNCECGCGCNCCHDEYMMGPTGPMGPQGERGAQGPRGLQGQQGREGLQGPRGEQGVTGVQGEPGMQGPTGAMGPRGYQGDAGSTGITGATGIQGPQGPQGNTGPAGQDAPVIQFASAALQSYTNKMICPQEALVFDVSNIQRGFTISPDYTNLCAAQQGTYVIQFGCLISNDVCAGNAIALELNNSMIIEESRMAVVGQSFVTGTVILTLRANDCIRLVCDSNEAFELCSMNETINAYLVIYQINS